METYYIYSKLKDKYESEFKGLRLEDTLEVEDEAEAAAAFKTFKSAWELLEKRSGHMELLLSRVKHDVESPLLFDDNGYIYNKIYHREYDEAE